MDLWIRSQDKKRLVKVKVEDVYIYDNQICIEGEVLGKYPNSMRALEILDEIQALLINQCVPPELKLYEMPEEYLKEVEVNDNEL